MGVPGNGGRPVVAGSELVRLQQTLYESRNPTRRWLHRTRLEWIGNTIGRHAVPGGRALEVGPGGGPYVPVLCDAFGSVVASDIEGDYLEAVRERMEGTDNLELVTDDVTASKLEPASFDLVLCSEVVEHVPDPAAAVQGIHGLLKPGGTLILSTPQPYSSVELLGRIAFKPGFLQIARLIYREPVLPTGHISLLTRRRLGEILVASGFEVAERWTSGLYIPAAAELGGEPVRRLEERLEGRLRGTRFAGALWTQYWVARRSA